MAKTIFQSVAWFKRYKTLKSVPDPVSPSEYIPEYIRKTKSHVLIGYRTLHLPSLANQRICLILHEYIPEYIHLVKSGPGRVGSGRVGSVGSVGRVAQVEKIIIFSESSLGLRPRS